MYKLMTEMEEQRLKELHEQEDLMKEQMMMVIQPTGEINKANSETQLPPGKSSSSK
jgi:hypothetical protein